MVTIKRKLVDPYMQDVPWEIIYDGKGKVLGEVFVLPYREINDGLVRRRKKKRSAK